MFKIGQEVIAYWTNAGAEFREKGTIKKINKRSMLVELDHDVYHYGTGGTYPKGFTVHVTEGQLEEVKSYAGLPAE